MPTMSTDQSEAPLAAASMDPTLYRFGVDGAVTIYGSRSAATGALFWPRRIRCPITGGLVEDVDLPGTGTIWSWTYVHTPWPGVRAPNPAADGYGAGLVDLDDNGPRVVALLLGGLDTFEVGRRVHALAFPFVDDPPRSMLAFAIAREEGQ